MSDESTERCALCGRALGSKVEWHHVMPKSWGGRDTVPLHPICHRTIHATLSEAELAKVYTTMDEVRTHPDIARFVKWVASKPPDFHKRTASRGDKRRR